MRTTYEERQLKLRYWAGIIHECQNSGQRTIDWLTSKGISKDSYYYWYKLVKNQCFDIAETQMQSTEVVSVSSPAFVELQVPTAPVERQAVPTPMKISSPSAVMHVGNITFDIMDSASAEFIRKLMEVAAHA
ncbi:MAG: hypothetical protein HUJ70_14515 [Pseudobutyrivibrio sp.]|nr:hypothetical protein [Pseudobutyrivibrio sp.]